MFYIQIVSDLSLSVSFTLFVSFNLLTQPRHQSALSCFVLFIHHEDQTVRDASKYRIIPSLLSQLSPHHSDQCLIE